MKVRHMSITYAFLEAVTCFFFKTNKRLLDLWIVNIESKIRLAAEKKLKLKVEYAKAPNGTAYFLLVVYMRSVYVCMCV